MATSDKSPKKKTGLSKAKQRELTRSKTIQAVLDIIVSDGMRAVRHRAVAERAGVSLGTTTYYFNNLEDLIISAFSDWRNRSLLAHNPYYQQIEDLLTSDHETLINEEQKTAIGKQIYHASVGYLLDQIQNHREDRIIELAFYHESMLYPSLREIIVNSWEPQQLYLEIVHRKMGSPAPKDDARITFTLFRQLEQNAIMRDETLDQKLIRRTLHRHMTLCFGIDIPIDFYQTI
jgi:DNA-binding transcriptional regulator YbjK